MVRQCTYRRRALELVTARRRDSSVISHVPPQLSRRHRRGKRASSLARDTGRVSMCANSESLRSVVCFFLPDSHRTHAAPKNKPVLCSWFLCLCEQAGRRHSPAAWHIGRYHPNVRTRVDCSVLSYLYDLRRLRRTGTMTTAPDDPVGWRRRQPHRLYFFLTLNF